MSRPPGPRWELGVRPVRPAPSPFFEPGSPPQSGESGGPPHLRRVGSCHVPATVVVGMQWGDESKGKFVDVLAEHADFVVRYAGGNNAGHTVMFDDTTLKLHLVPSGIARPDVVPVIADGVVLDPVSFLEEVEQLDQLGLDPSRIKLSANAHLIMPYHRLLDRLFERSLGKNKLGTTKRGIGPCYADKAMRIGLRVQDLFDADIFWKKLHTAGKEKNRIFAKVYDELPLDLEVIGKDYLEMADQLRPFVADTFLLLNEALEAGQHVVFEGAQATMLDLDHGTYPFVTSSSTTAASACVAAGVGPRHITRIVGITKAYSTRVGAGPFPTEVDGAAGVHMVSAGEEFGTTTGRQRRCGWYDAVLNRYAGRLNQITELVVAKLDVLSGLDPIRICTQYEIEGERSTEMPYHQSDIHRAAPVYEDLPGWSDDIRGCTKLADLPAAARAYLDRLEELAGVPVTYVGTGPRRTETIATK